MKSFVATLLLLVAMLFGILFNALYINKVANEMTSMLNALPQIGHPDCVAATSALEEYWSRQVRTVDLSVNYSVVDRVTEQVALLSTCAKTGDLYGYYSALTLLRNALEDLAHTEKPGVWNIL